MTKIKNTKKGMAKKTLSMSLVVAMLATSNVPVWAAEFSDGTDAAVTSEAETPAVEDGTADTAAEAFTAEEAPAVNNEADVNVATAQSDYTFDIQVEKKAINPTWAKKVEAGTFTAETVFGDSTIKLANGNNYSSGLNYAWAYNNAWETKYSLSSGTLKTAIDFDKLDLKNHVNETLSLVIVENDSKIAEISLGTIKPVDLKDIANLSINNISTQTYNGAEKKPTVAVSGDSVADTYDKDYLKITGNYTWSYAGSNGLVNAGSIVTVTGTLTGDKAKYYTGTLTKTFTIEKLAVTSNSLIVKVANTDKEIAYTGNNEETVDASEVNVYLPDANDGTKASNISLNEYIKKVTVDASSTGRQGLTVTLDGTKLKNSTNFSSTNDADVTLTKTSDDTNTGTKNTVKVVPVDLSGITATLKNPKKVQAKDHKPNVTANDLTFTKDGKELNLAGVTVTVAGGDYTKPGTYHNAITITGNDQETKGQIYADLVIATNVFAANATFKTKSSALSSVTPSTYVIAVSDIANLPSNGLDYNNGKAVEFKADDVLTEAVGAKLGWFDPTGNSTTNWSQKDFSITYKNNINADASVSDRSKWAVLTVTAVDGAYKGCSKDFYFKINESKVTPTSDDKTTTVTVKSPKGVSINDANRGNAAAYADAIGLAINGTNDAAQKKDEIISNATANDYKVDYTFVKAAADGKPSETPDSNAVGNYVKATVTLKENGNFIIANAQNNFTRLGSDSSVYYKASVFNRTVTLYVPIVDKAIEGLDVSLDQTSYTYTGETIKPKVTVKLNGVTYDEGKDYTVSVKNGINVGTADVVVKMLPASGYQGSKTLSATITPAKLSDVKFEIIKGKEQVYDGTQKKPLLEQDDDTTTPNKDESVSASEASATVKLGSVDLSKLFDISFGTNVNAGKDAGTVTLTPKKTIAKNFDGDSVTATFDIERRTLENKSVTNSGTTTYPWSIKVVNDDGKIINRDGNNVIAANETDFEWTGSETVFANASLVDDNIVYVNTPTATIRKNNLTYKLAYANNVEKTTTAAPAYVCVVGTGNYGGDFSIVKAKDGSVRPMLTKAVTETNKKNPGTYEVLLDNVLANSWASFQIEGRKFAAKNVTITNATYAGGVAVKPGSVVKDSKTGAVLTEGKDYELVFDTKNVDATTTPIEVSAKGIGQYKGSLVNAKTDGKKLTFVIEKKDLKDCSVSVDKNLKLTVMNGNVLETKENFTVKDNGDGTATVSVVDGGKNYTGSVNVEIGGRKVGAPMISNVKVVGNKATVILSDDVEGASGYDYVISTDKDCITNKDYAAVNKNQAKTTTTFKYVDKGTYYAYCHAWTRDANGKKVFGEWSNGFQFSVTATTPDAPVITNVKVSGSTIKVTYRPAANATGYDVVLGTSSKKDNGELRPYNYGDHKKLNLKEGTVTATFKNVPKGTWTVGMHAFNRTSIDNKKVFSPWSNLETAKVK